ncbi:MAG: HPr family phosphocarrier protein [Eubacterium sp.]|nr:HPr family phosphocarrier protein [Eubacterium sp.]MDD7209914.1 HPr family phosphocarrier protein [Lachnospiraceae bacterium]MDY5498234.1 HPr family phosphocarrier protein [Anaerobutyricum sp.]
MQTIRYTLAAGQNLHARPAVELVAKIQDFESSIVIRCKKREADAKNIMELLSLHIMGGDTIEVKIIGVDEEMAKKEIVHFLGAD